MSGISRLEKISKIIIGITIAALSLLGLASYAYSFKQKKFRPYYPLAVYTVCLIIAFTLVYVRDIIESFQRNEFDLGDAGKVYSYLNIFSALVSYINALYRTKSSVRFMNHLELFQTLKFFDIEFSAARNTLLLLALKSIMFPIGLALTLLIRQLRNEPEKSIFTTFYSILPWILANIVPNLFFCTLVINKQMLFKLNTVLLEIVKEVNFLQSKLQMNLQKPFYRMQRFCDLADKLDNLARKYTVICDQSQEYFVILAPSFVCSILCNLVGITAGLFAHYHAIADTLINDDNYDQFNALTNSVFLIVYLAEIGLQAYLSNESLVVAQETGHLLQRMNLLYADIRFKQSVENFSLLLVAKKFKIQPCGLLEVNVSLLQDVLSTVTSFLLILIQADLALRFSLK